MTSDSKKIFKAYILSKNIEKQHVKENIIHKFFDPSGYAKKRTFEGYLDLWQSFWSSKFRNEKELTQNREIAVNTFENFLNSRTWANPNIRQYKEAALGYFNDNLGKISLQNLEDDVFEILLYGKTKEGWTPEKGKYKILPKGAAKSKETEPGPESSEPLSGIDPEEYKSMTPEERAEFHKKYYAKTADAKKTKLISVPKAKPPVKYKIIPR